MGCAMSSEEPAGAPKTALVDSDAQLPEEL